MNFSYCLTVITAIFVSVVGHLKAVKWKQRNIQSFQKFHIMAILTALVVILLVSSGWLEVGNMHEIPVNTPPNDRPIIALLSQEVTPGLLPPEVQGMSYIAASYVKYIESAGARVVPVTTKMKQQEVEDVFKSVNGVLYPGGDALLFDSKYYTNAKYFYDLALSANMRGDFFPVWGTCLGFQALTCLTAGKLVLSYSNAVDITIPLNLTSDAKNSRMLRDAPENLINELRTEGITYNYHYNCVTPETFLATKALKDAYNILSYNNDVNGKTFVSTIEGKKFPFYGTQWHPEKNSFEWNEKRNIAHSKDAVQATQYFADFFVNEARKSQHRFPSKELENKYLIYRYRSVYTGDAGHFEECYIFD